MTSVELQKLSGDISIGKHLPGACYVASEALDHLPSQLKELIDHLASHFPTAEQLWNQKMKDAPQITEVVLDGCARQRHAPARA